MRINNYFFRFAISVIAFVLGVGLFGVGQYFSSVTKANNRLAAQVQTVTVEEITYPQSEIENTPVIDPDETRPEEYSEEKVFDFNADGEYYIIGDLPKGFKEFETLYISTMKYEEKSADVGDWVPIPPQGTVYAKKEFRFTRIYIANKLISLETEVKKGISYKFVGKFIEPEEISVGEYVEEAVLEGHLIKIRDGKKIAESEVKLAILHGC